MPAVTIYHNPRCSKSRKTLELLEEHGVHPKIVLYLETPLTRAEISGLLGKLGLTAGEVVRRGEDQYKASGLGKDSSDEQILAAMAKHPKTYWSYLKHDRALCVGPVLLATGRHRDHGTTHSARRGAGAGGGGQIADRTGSIRYL